MVNSGVGVIMGLIPYPMRLSVFMFCGIHYRFSRTIGRCQRWLLISLLLPIMSTHAAQVGDTHYIEVGFFDIHVCNWPDRQPFYMALFSTTRYDELVDIEIFDVQGRSLGKLPLDRFRLLKRDGQPEKRVFIDQLSIAPEAADGWFEARIRLRNGSEHKAKDYVIHQLMPLAAGLEPTDGAEDIPLPQALRWAPVAGAKHYQVFVRDLWDGEKVILESELLNEPHLQIPPGLLKPGGLYEWRVHARDVNEHVLLGDFNNGSLTRWVQFSVSE